MTARIPAKLKVFRCGAETRFDSHSQTSTLLDYLQKDRDQRKAAWWEVCVQSASAHPVQGLTTMSPDQVADVEVNAQILALDIGHESMCTCQLH